MQADRLDQIQNLIQKADILSVPEKNEWLELMELMNDRQLLELERILLDTRKPAPAAPALVKPVVIPTVQVPVLPAKPKPSVPTPSLQVAAGFKQPPFSHILNLPTAAGLQPPPNVSSQTAPGRAPGATLPPKKDSVFLTRLKAIFAEKELPPPAASAHEQMLPAGQKELAKAPVVATPPKVIPPQVINLPELLELPKSHPKPPVPVKLEPAKIPKHKPAEKHHPAPAEAAPKIKSPQIDMGKPENVTINVFVNSEEDKNKIPGLAQAQDIISKMAAPAAVAQPAESKVQESKAQPAQEPSAKKPEPKSEFKIEQPAPKAATPAEPPPTVVQSFNIIQPANIMSPSGYAVQQPVGYGAPVAPVPVYEVAAPGGKIPEDKSAAAKENEPKPPKEKEARTDTHEYGSVSAGLNFSDDSTLDKLKDKLAGKDKPPTKPVVVQSSRVALQEKPGDSITLETLADLDALKPADLQQHATGTIFRKMQGLIAQHGQHEVVFHLEKSPLYKAYINSGTAWLKQGGKVPSAASELPPEDFERFADLLIIMRSRA